MDFSGISGGGVSPQLQRLSAQAQAQALPEQAVLAQQQNLLPTDSVGLQSKSAPSNPLSPEKRLSDLKPDELAKLGGGSALETLAQAQGSLTIGEARPLLNNKPALESIAGLMSERSDLKVSDFVSRVPKGKVMTDPSYKDPEAMEFLKERQDVTPSEVSSMRANFTKKFKNPRMGKEASKKAIALMKKRPDLKPEDAGKLMDSLGSAVGMDDGKKTQGQNPEAAGQAALDMFDSASKILTKRPDMDPSRVGELANSVGKLGSPKDKNRPAQVAEGFESAAKSLEQNPLREPEEMSSLASTIGDNFRGQDEKSGAAKMNAFKSSSKMLGEQSHMNADTVNGFLQQAKKQNPKIGDASGGKGAQKLAGALGDMAAGVSNGTVSAQNPNSYFNTDGAKVNGFKPMPKRDGTQGNKKPGQQAGKKTGQQSDKKNGQAAEQGAKTPAGTGSKVTGTAASSGPISSSEPAASSTSSETTTTADTSGPDVTATGISSQRKG